jgi:hypothetical protein
MRASWIHSWREVGASVTLQDRKDESRHLLHESIEHPSGEWADISDAIDAYAAVCVAEALAPRAPSPELAEAERWLRHIASYGGSSKNADGGPYCPTSADAWRFAPAIAAELTRLRAIVSRLESAPSRTLYVPCKDDAEALDAVTGHGFWTGDPAKVAGWVRGGETVRVVELRVKGTT